MPPEHVRLREAVERFADDPPAHQRPSSTPPPALLRDLRARRRRARAVPAYVPGVVAAASVVAIVLAVVAGIPTLLDDRSRVADTPPVELIGAIPQRIDVPGDWISTDQTPGVAAVAMPWSHGQLLGGDDYRGVVTVSAETGAYTWVDLPLAYFDTPVIGLSPTGRFLAYWAGEPRPRTPDGRYLPDLATELRVRDLVTGDEVSHAPRDIPKGASVLWDNLDWLDATRVGASYGRVDSVSPNGSSSTSRRPFVLDAVDGDVTLLEGDSLLARAVGDGGLPGAPLVARRYGRDGRGGELIVLRPDGEVERRLAPDTLSGQSRLALSPGRTRLVELSAEGPRADPGALRVTSDPGGEPSETRRVALDGLEVYELLGWRDENHVVAQGLRLRADGRVVARGYPVGAPIVSIDLRDGRWEQISRAVSISGLDVADELWTVPTADRDADASPPDPRLLYGGLVLGLGALGWWVWARRRLLRARSS